ncbi:MAG: twin-arginine translocase subunit TatC [Thermodesulfobacteriaceae bacterium]|nr:twin-arginine translocase subunit TatC [Thermodesulfobacteriaceae bacterium]MDW8135617.1 twin-arginine translocase subunit TatC [Thermodesulfobacterium sp.]
MVELKEEIEDKKSFLFHLIELRSCIIKAFLGWIFFSILVYLKVEEIIEFLLRPLYESFYVEKVIFFKTFPEVFSIYIKIALIGGFILGSPYIFFQFWNFIAPGLYFYEKRWIKKAFLLTCFAFLFGSSLAYFVFLPFIMKILYSLGESFLVFKPLLTDYITFVLKMFLLFGIVFQLPSFLLFLFSVKLINSHLLRLYRGYFIILFFLVSALITSSKDPLDQILLGLFLTILYEVSIILIKIVEVRRNFL